MRIVRKFLTGGPISAAATVAQLPGVDGPVIVAGSDALYAWRAGDGSLLPGFPVRGGNFFASRPLVADLNGIGQSAIYVGCDDDALYGFDSAGRLLPGFPLKTGGDVYSSPAAADLDDDGVLELVAGSDDGCLYVWRPDGSLLPGWPQQTAGFVSASPTIVDLDGDGRLEIISGSWDRGVYAWRGDGSLLPSWPRETGHFVWSTPQAADLSGDGGLELIAASDQVYVWGADGRLWPGWPQATGSYVVANPAIGDLDGDGRPEIIVAADQVYAWRLNGQSLPGFPVDLGSFLWASPLLEQTEEKETKIIVAGWDGRLYALDAQGAAERITLSREPIFASPTLADLAGNQQRHLLVGAWDGALYQVDLQAEADAEPFAQAGAQAQPADSLASVKEATAPFISFPGSSAAGATMYYQADLGQGSAEDSAEDSALHLVPLVVHEGVITGLVQPFPAGTTVRLWAEINGRRLPDSGDYGYQVRADWPGRLRRKIRRWRTAQ